MVMQEKPLVFVSCGQYTTGEKQLGRDVCGLLRELRPDVVPYFAENQSSVEGLSKHILRALFRSAGFICIMHNRGELTTPDNKPFTRGSVWLEQEIAVTAFMKHELKRSVPILYYKQVGVGVEGIRSVLLMNPRVEFTREEEVLVDLRSVLPSTDFNPFLDYDLTSVAKYEERAINGDRPGYRFIADVLNSGNQRVTDFRMLVFFPRAFVNPSTTWYGEDKQRSTQLHICFVADAKTRAPNGMYPGDRLNNPLEIDYFVDRELFRNLEAMSSEIVIELDSGSMKRKRESLLIRNLQVF